MKKTIQRVMALALCLIICLSALPMETMAVEGLPIDAQNFEDEIFRNFVCTRFDIDGSKSLSEAEINDVTEIHCQNLGIASLKGIEHFPNLSSLVCADNRLFELDVSQNKGLSYLECYGNQISTLDVSNNPILTYLCCNDNQLTSLDLSNNKQLDSLWCSYNCLDSLDLANNPYLRYLECVNNIEILDLRNNPYLAAAVTQGLRGQSAKGDPCYCIPDLMYYVYIDFCTRVLVGDSAPTVISNPESKTASIGKKVLFKVAAEGEGLTYLWYYQKPGETLWSKMPQEVQAELEISVTAEKNGYKYCCEITNKDGRAGSKTAILKVDPKPTISTQPKAVSIKAGKKVTFKVKASGEGLKYQWYRLKPGTKNWTKISKATKATYSFKAAKKWNGYKYKCLVKNEAGKVYSKAVKLTVK